MRLGLQSILLAENVSHLQLTPLQSLVSNKFKKFPDENGKSEASLNYIGRPDVQ